MFSVPWLRFECILEYNLQSAFHINAQVQGKMHGSRMHSQNYHCDSSENRFCFREHRIMCFSLYLFVIEKPSGKDYSIIHGLCLFKVFIIFFIFYSIEITLASVAAVSTLKKKQVLRNITWIVHRSHLNLLELLSGSLLSTHTIQNIGTREGSCPLSSMYSS